MSVDVVMVGDHKLLAHLHSSGKVVNEEVYRACVEAGIRLEASAKLFVPKRTGALAKAIRSNVTRLPQEWHVSIEVSESTPYGPWVEYGTGAFGLKHAPYRGVAIGNYPSQRVPPRATPVRTEYWHPGMRPRPYIRPAFDVNQNWIHHRFERMGDTIARRLGGKM